MEETTRLDEVTVFDGMLSFLIPHSWEEKSGENDYLYSQPGADSGWFRVSLNTARAVDETPAQMLKRKFEGRENVTEDTQTGNWVCTYERDSEEQGEKIHLYYWVVAHVVEPDLVREAVFSYTVLSGRTNEQQTRKMLGLIEQIVNRANFTPEPSDSSGHNS
jgi:Domain of unknown function (DUF3805)